MYFQEEKLLLKLKSSGSAVGFLPQNVLLPNKYPRMLKRKPSVKQITSHVFAAEHHECSR